MDTNKLMIGDKVLVKVLSQIPDTFVVHTWTAEDYMRDLQMVKPIPLTAEILEKNGFRFYKAFGEIHPYYYLAHKFSMKCAINGDGHFYLDCIGADIRIHYVHELQHVLRLCGLDELADNFKIE